MITLDRIVTGPTEITDSLTLPFDLRQKSRQRVTLGSGREAAWMMERGLVLRGNDRLGSASGDVVLVIAAKEQVSTVASHDPRLLARVAYHLGNRHIPLEVGDGYVRYQHDHVLDHMVLELGLTATVEHAAFEPEGGAYGQHEHSHSRESHPHVMLRGRLHGHGGHGA